MDLNFEWNCDQTDWLVSSLYKALNRSLVVPPPHYHFWALIITAALRIYWRRKKKILSKNYWSDYIFNLVVILKYQREYHSSCSSIVKAWTKKKLTKNVSWFSWKQNSTHTQITHLLSLNHTHTHMLAISIIVFFGKVRTDIVVHLLYYFP